MDNICRFSRKKNNWCLVHPFVLKEGNNIRRSSHKAERRGGPDGGLEMPPANIDEAASEAEQIGREDQIATAVSDDRR
jgi:hypothetical protein